jgi:hypothetical protein
MLSELLFLDVGNGYFNPSHILTDGICLIGVGEYSGNRGDDTDFGERVGVGENGGGVGIKVACDWDGESSVEYDRGGRERTGGGGKVPLLSSDISTT